MQQHAQTISQADPACSTPEGAHHPTAQTTVALKIWGPLALPVSTALDTAIIVMSMNNRYSPWQLTRPVQ